MVNNNDIITRRSTINPYWDPPRESTWYDYVENADVSLSSGETTLIDFTLPLASIGVIRWFGQKSSSSYDSITWKIRVNNGPDMIYGNIIGLISDLYYPNDVLIKIPRGSNVKLVVTNSSATAMNITGRLKGWYWEDDIL